MKNIKLYLLMSLLLLSVACEDFLEKEPYHQPVQENYWQTGNDVEKALNGAYALLRVAFNDKVAYYTYGDVPSDEFNFAGFEDYNNVRMFNLGERLNENSAYRTIVHLRDWTGYYRVINHASNIIEKIEQVPVDDFNSLQEKENMLGEAHFIRGFTYLYMTRIWGDVPLITDAIEDPVYQPYLPRAEKELVWTQIEQDLLMAAEKMSWSYNKGANNAVRGGKGAVFATLAHLYAWVGDYKKTAIAADSVIQHGNYNLVNGSNYEDIFDFPTQENIFEIAMNVEDEEEFTEGGEFTIGRKLLKFPYTVHSWQVEPEWRIEVTRFRNLYNIEDGQVADSVEDLRIQSVFRDIGSFMPVCIKYDNTGYEFPERNANFYVSNNIIVFRLAGIMLLRAEALAVLGQDGAAKSLLDAVRMRAGLPPYDGDNSLFMAVMEERARELFCEGHRFFDMIRLKRQVPEFQFPFINDADFAAGKYYWPVEPLLRSNDPALEQTEFWRSQM